MGFGNAEHHAPIQRCEGVHLDHGVRTVLLEHFAEVYDFSQYAARDRTLGQWLDVMGCVLRMLRSTSVANLASRVG